MEGIVVLFIYRVNSYLVFPLVEFLSQILVEISKEITASNYFFIDRTLTFISSNFFIKK
jgi:hypothetical protein